MISCPRCNHNHIVKNGTIHNGKQKYACRNCNRQFVLNPKNKTISEDQKKLINKLLLERISLAGIARVTGISERSIQTYVNNLYASISMIVNVSTKEIRRLDVQCDEMWSFVNNKGNKIWIWLALDVETREIIGFHAGDRSYQSAKKLWDSLPPEYRQCAVLIFGMHTQKFFHQKDMLPLEKKQEKQATSSGLTVHFAKESRG